jgi:hypothetical protein
MAVKKRCIFCHKPLRDDGYCENTKCVDYERTRIHDEENEQKKGEDKE